MSAPVTGQVTGPALPGEAPRGQAGRARTAVVSGVALVMVALVGASLTFRGHDDRLMVMATFDDASPLLKGNDVRAHGVKVGTVSSIAIHGRDAVVGLELDPAALPVHRDAAVSIRPVSLLGERYVDLDPGTPGAPLMRDRGTIAAARTGSATGLDEVLDSLDEPTSKALGLLVAGLGGGLDTNGARVDRAVRALAPSFTQAGRLSDVLRDQNDTLGRLVDAMEPVARGLAADDGGALDDLVASTQQVLSTTAADDRAFRSLVAELPSTLATAIGTLQRLEGATATVTPTLARLRPTTRQLKDLSGELRTWADAADPALRSSVPVLRKAQRLLAEARPVAAALRAQGPSLQSTATTAQPLVGTLAGRFTTVMEFFKGWALATNSRDGLAHYFRAGLVLTPYSGTGLVPTATGGGASGPKPVPGLPDVVGQLGDTLDGLVGMLPGGLLSGRTDSKGGVTGLTATQETNALGFLLGGN